jgi:hypothetical protein
MTQETLKELISTATQAGWNVEIEERSTGPVEVTMVLTMPEPRRQLLTVEFTPSGRVTFQHSGACPEWQKSLEFGDKVDAWWRQIAAIITVKARWGKE